jgi:hypothetical protein
MAIDPSQVSPQVFAFVSTLRNLPEKRKEQFASVQYCEELNRLLELAKEAVPGIDARLWPTPIPIDGPTTVRYVEIETIAHRIVALLPYPGFSAPSQSIRPIRKASSP